MSSWFGEGLSNLKGQISNFTKEVLAEASAENAELSPDQNIEEAQAKIAQLELTCSSKDTEIARLLQRTQELESRLKLPQTSAPTITTQHPQLLAVTSQNDSSIIEEEQDGWSQFSEEDFPCLQEQGDFVSSTPAATAKTSNFDNKTQQREIETLRTKLRDAEARVRDLKEQQSPQTGGGKLHDLLTAILKQDNKDVSTRKQGLDSLVSLIHAQLGIEDTSAGEAQTTIASLQQQRDELRDRLESVEKEAEEFRLKVTRHEEENLNLSRSLEELDEQNQAALERLLALKEATQREKEVLEEKLKSSQAQADATLQAELSQLECDIRAALSQSLPECVAQEVRETESVVVLGRAVARQCADLVWKKEASERKLAEVTREARELRQELGTARSEVNKLREHSERLMAQLSVSGPSGSSGALEPIPEGREEEGDVAIEEVPEQPSEASVQGSVDALQREADALREARVNLEAEVTTLRTENQSLVSRVRSLGAELRNQENLQREAASMQEKANSLQRQVEDATLYRETLENEVATLRQETSSLREQLCSSEVVKRQLQQTQALLAKNTDEQTVSLQKVNEELVMLRSRLDQISAEKKDSESTNETLRKQLEELKNSSDVAAKLEEEIRLLEDEKQKVKSEVKKLDVECEGVKTQLTSRDKQIEELETKMKESLSEMKTKLEQSEAAYREDKQGLTQKISELTEERNKLQLQCQYLQDTLEQEEQQLTKDKAELEKDLGDKLHLGMECERLQLEVENALGEKLKLEQNIEQLTKEMDELRLKLQVDNQVHEEVIQSEKNMRSELENKFTLMEKSYMEVIQATEDLKEETKKWKAQAELVMNKTEEDDSLIRTLEMDIAEWKNKAVNIEESYQTTSQGYQEIVKAMEAKESLAKKLEGEKEKLRLELENVNSLLESKTLDCISLEETIMQLQEQNNESSVIQTNEIGDLETKCETYQVDFEQVSAKLSEVESQKTELLLQIDALNKQLQEEQKKVQLEVDNFNLISQEMKNLETLRLEVITEHHKLKEELCLVSKKLELVELEKSALESKFVTVTASSTEENQLFELRKKKEVLEQENLQLKQNIVELETVKHQLAALNAEKLNILGVLDEKTRENSSLRSENHRLVALVATEKSTSQQLLQEKTEILSRKEFQSSEASEMARESVASLAKIIRDKDQEMESLKSKNQSLLTLMQDSNPGLAIHQLFANHPDVELMKNEVHTLQQEKTQLVHSLQQKHQESLQYHAEIQRLSAALSLASRPGSVNIESTASSGADVENLMHALSQEQQRNKFLQNEVQELSEKEGALQGELGRLRQHLLSVEEQYTEEALRSEQLANELRSQLAVAEERARNTVTSLSSASARAGQQVELLQEQARVAIVQRDEALRRLSSAEEEVRHHATGLRNLQTVLEQFQQDKERDIELASERLRQQLKVAEQRNDQLLADIKALQGQLQEAKEGLSAAARLGVQMDKKSEQITQLKDEVARLGEQLHQAQGQINSASQSMEGKVDKYLVKNLIVGYFMAAPNNRLEALRIVATVLDFSREERARVGLEAGTPGRGSATKVGPQTQSLAEAFIRFLENESRPVPQVRMLEEAVGRQRKASPAPGKSPLLMSDVVLPTFTPVATTLASVNSPSSSSSTLKDVLRDS